MNKRGRPKGKAQPRVRMNLDMNPSTRDCLERLSEATDTSMSEVLRKSIAIYDLIQREQEGGGTVVVRNGDREKEIAIV